MNIRYFYFLLTFISLSLSATTKSPYPITDDFYEDRTPSWLSKKMQAKVGVCAKYILFQRAKISCAEIRQTHKAPPLLKRLCALTPTGKTAGEAACLSLQDLGHSQQNCIRHCGQFSCSKPTIYMQCKILREGFNGTPICLPLSVNKCLSKNAVYHERASTPNPLIAEVAKAIHAYKNRA